MINSGNYGSTGNIMIEIADVARTKGHIVYTACPDGKSMRKKQLDNHIYIGNRIGRNLHIKLSSITGLHGMFSIIDTKVFLKKLDKIKPDVIHLHNLHSCYINLPMLFGYIKKHHIRVIWTLHDCWAFTGQCPHFTMVNCEKWKTGCSQCPQYRSYPSAYVDQTKLMWKLKKKWFTGVEDLTIVTPSKWLGDLVNESFLEHYPVKIIYNGINLEVFKPYVSNIRKELGIKENEYMLLGVAFGWEKRKGLDVFIQLATTLDEHYKIVLVGTNDEVEKELPSNIISIHRTENQEELTRIYSAADLFVNPTREEVLGMVNLEALACGTPVITFKSGGSPECVNNSCGVVVPCDDISAMRKHIEDIISRHLFSENACRQFAKRFDIHEKYREYVEVFEAWKEKEY